MLFAVGDGDCEGNPSVAALHSPANSSSCTAYMHVGSIRERLVWPEVSCGNTATSSNSLTRYTEWVCSWNTGDIFLVYSAEREREVKREWRGREGGRE